MDCICKADYKENELNSDQYRNLFIHFSERMCEVKIKSINLARDG